MSGVSYHFDSVVFTTKEFPAGSLQQSGRAQIPLDSIQVATTFYNEKFEEVKEADTPGRYGAIAHLSLGDGTTIDRFVTLYRAPDGAQVKTVNLGNIKVSVETGTDPDTLRRQQEELDISLKIVMAGDTTGIGGFGALAGLAMMMPGLTPDQVLSNVIGYLAIDNQWWFDLRKDIGQPQSYPYMIQLPEGYEADAAKHWPLLLYLHGSGERGTDLINVKRDGPPFLIAHGKKFPAIVIAPQTADAGWSAPVLAQLIDDISAKYRVDPDQIMVTGMSMGGGGTWALAEAYPDRFSCIVPICGFGDLSNAGKLTKLPIWVFHNQGDNVVPFMLSQSIVNAIRGAGGNPHLTIYPVANHNAWTQAYGTEAVWNWMFAQRRGTPEIKTPGLQEP